MLGSRSEELSAIDLPLDCSTSQLLKRTPHPGSGKSPIPIRSICKVSRFCMNSVPSYTRVKIGLSTTMQSRSHPSNVKDASKRASLPVYHSSRMGVEKKAMPPDMGGDQNSDERSALPCNMPPRGQNERSDSRSTTKLSQYRII